VSEPRLYEEKAATVAVIKESKATLSALPLFGVIATFSAAAFVAMRMQRHRSTRQVQMTEVPQSDEEAFLSEQSDSPA